jgi:hypothetical protein
MSKRALLIGIDEYQDPGIRNLRACVSDAAEIQDVLARNGDGSVNFDCRTLTGPGPASVTRALLRRRWRELFADFKGDILFYFSGHGSPCDVGGFLVTQDAVEDDPGLPMNELIDMANTSAANTVLVILDCCYSGAAGNAAASLGSLEHKAVLREGVTILAASRPTQEAMEIGGHGVFTRLVLGALRGGAADVRGRVSAASIYGYVEAALGAWGQRPVYKSHAGHLDPVRTSLPKVTDEHLREITGYFPGIDDEYRLDPTYEETEKAVAVPANVGIYKKFKTYQIAGLLCPVVGPDLYWAAKRSESVKLTELGKFYHELVVTNRI